MAITLYQYGNCEDGLIGSGLRNCNLDDFGDLVGTSLIRPGTKWNLAADTLDRAEWVENLKELKLFPYLSSSEFTDNTEDNETNTSTTGIIETIRQGKPYYELQYRRGGCMHKSLYNKKGFGKWDTILVFDKGILMRVTADNQELRGFTTGDFSVETLRLKSGTDLQRTISRFQLIYPDEINAYHVFFSWESLGFSVLDIEGVVETMLDVSVSSATELSVKVTSSCNTDDVILGLDDDELWSLIGGTETVTSVVFNADTQRYELTLSGAITGEFTLKLSQGGYNVVEDLDGGLYKGQSTFDTNAPSV